VKRSGAWPHRPPSGPFVAGRGSHFLGLSLSGGKVHRQDPLRLEHGLVLWRHMLLDRGSALLAGELASLWCCLWLSSGLPSTDLCLLPSLMSMVLLEREAGVRPSLGLEWVERSLSMMWL
jgi:hypothetical protein